jgi:hypothetical protein
VIVLVEELPMQLVPLLLVLRVLVVHQKQVPVECFEVQDVIFSRYFASL